MKKFLIGGDICDTKFMPEDITPHDIKDFLDTLEDGEDVVFEINSFGGSCSAGISICNMIKQCGHKTTAHVIGIAASIASVIACACDELQIDSNAFLMVHNPYCTVQGNSNDLRKEADTLDKFKQALLSIYKSKFNLTPDRISELLDCETWILGSDAEVYKLNCTVIPVDDEIEIAAHLDSTKMFNNIPNKLKTILESKNMKKILIKNNVKAEEVEKTDPEKTEEVEKSSEENTEEQTEKTGDENTDEEEKKEVDPQERIDELEKEVEALKAKLAEYEKKDECGEEEKETVSKEVADKRVSGMQSKMQSQINDLKKDYENKLNDLTVQHKSVSDELVKAQAKITSINDSLVKTQKELEETLSTLQEKQVALDELNSNVLAQKKELPTMQDGLSKCKTPSEKVAFLMSGQYK